MKERAVRAERRWVIQNRQDVHRVLARPLGQGGSGIGVGAGARLVTGVKQTNNIG